MQNARTTMRISLSPRAPQSVTDCSQVATMFHIPSAVAAAELLVRQWLHNVSVPAVSRPRPAPTVRDTYILLCALKRIQDEGLTRTTA